VFDGGCAGIEEYLRTYIETRLFYQEGNARIRRFQQMVRDEALQKKGICVDGLEKMVNVLMCEDQGKDVTTLYFVLLVPRVTYKYGTAYGWDHYGILLGVLELSLSLCEMEV